MASERKSGASVREADDRGEPVRSRTKRVKPRVAARTAKVAKEAPPLTETMAFFRALLENSPINVMY
ncbi:MAG: hypothetical protein AB7P00_01155, partial [Sandaracinaceae bacterium]